MSWNLGDILDAVEAVVPPESVALRHGERSLSWSEFSAASNRLVRSLIERGGQPGDKVAIYMRNAPEYLVAIAACFKGRFVHVNVNYRYLDDELAYIIDNSDAKFVLFDGEFAERCDAIRGRLTGVRSWLQVGGSLAPFADDFGELTGEGDPSPLGIERSPDDLMFLYTGGTTGMPKGVMWRSEDVWFATGGGLTIPANRKQMPKSVAEHASRIAAYGPGPHQVPCCPLMHGTGLFMVSVNLMAGGCVQTLTAPSFDPEELFDRVAATGVQSLVIVGDAFAKPMLRVLDANPGRWDLSSLRAVISSGVMWSHEAKVGLLQHLPQATMADLFGSSEAIGFGSSVTSAKGASKTAKFSIGDRCKVFTEDHREVVPGSGERGYIARTGPIPVGYYKDEAKTAKTFPVIDGVRYSIPGDWCTVEADGSITLLGRGSNCINTAGEKVYPEEVEETLKLHEDVHDALVVGLPDEKWGQAVTAVVELQPGATLDEAALRAHVRERLAGYKTPKRVVAVAAMFRAPNGKADYKGATAYARDAV